MEVSGLLLDWRQVTGKGDRAAGSCELRPRSPSGRGRGPARSPSSSVVHGGTCISHSTAGATLFRCPWLAGRPE